MLTSAPEAVDKVPHEFLLGLITESSRFKGDNHPILDSHRVDEFLVGPSKNVRALIQHSIRTQNKRKLTYSTSHLSEQRLPPYFPGHTVTAASATPSPGTVIGHPQY